MSILEQATDSHEACCAQRVHVSFVGDDLGWWLVAGGWWLVAGGWWLVAGGWWRRV
jgi:hypothetical protein